MALLPTLIGRENDLEFIRQTTADGGCCGLVGVSNLGKSALLRHLCDPASHSPGEGTYVYVDCNQMGERTAQAFFAVTWRALAARLEKATRSAERRAQVRHWSESLVSSPNVLAARLDFGDGMALALQTLPPPLVLCWDEFDEAFRHLEPQALLNLRAFKDQHGAILAFVTATEREPARLCESREQGEFYELIAPHIRYLRFWNAGESARFCRLLAEREHVTFDDLDLAFIRENAGGHPGLTQAVCYALGPVTGETARTEEQDSLIHRVLQENLSADPTVLSECAKIWDDLEDEERQVLLTPRRNGDPLPEALDLALRKLRAKSILRDSEEGPALFGRLFETFVRRQRLLSRPNAHGVYIDAGNAWVEGNPVEGLTDLEYRLLLCLYGQMDKIVDKYAIVQSVWGEEYIDQVDDARIEKLVSRLRSKIEPDAAHPRYLQSVRGRGCKLLRA